MSGPLSPRIVGGIDGVQGQELALELDDGRHAGGVHRAHDGDRLAGEEALIQLPGDPIDTHDVVVPDAAGLADLERLADLGLVEVVGARMVSVDGGRRATEEPGMGRLMIALDEGAKAGVELFERQLAFAEDQGLGWSSRMPRRWHAVARTSPR